MAGPINTGSNPKALWEGMQGWWGTNYDDHPLEVLDLFTKKNSSKSYEEVGGLIGFGLAPKKAEGSSISYDTQQAGITSRYTNETFALGFKVTHEEQKDNLYIDDIAFDRLAMLEKSMRTSKEIVGANLYNRAFNTAYNPTGETGVALLSASHVTADGTQSNLLTAADISEAALEDIAIQINNAKDPRGLQIALKPMDIIIPTASEFEVCRILKSVLQNNTATNAINALQATGAFKGYKINHYLTDDDAWFVRTDAMKGMTMFQREEMNLSEDNDFDTKNLKYAAMERYSFGASDFRGIYGSAGV